jgi:ABC-type multidrug transport system fused ATPase/permease subunit
MKISLIIKLLEKREKRQLLFVFFALLVMGVIELIGVGSIGPFISVISNPKIIHTNNWLDKAYNYFNFTSDNAFIIGTGIIVIIILVLSNLFLSGINFIIYYFSAKRQYSLSMRLFEKYLCQPYIFFLNINTAELAKNILNDVNTFVNYGLISFLQMASSVIISLGIITLLILLNPALALIISFVLGFSYITIFSLTKKYLAKKGKERSFQSTQRFKIINETFGGIKDIKILGKEKNFLNSFSTPSKKFSMNDAMNEVVNDIPKHLIETIAIGGILAIIIIMIYSGAKIDNFLPILSVYAFGAYRLLPSLQKIFRAFATIRYHLPIIENLENVLIHFPAGIELVDENIPRLDFYRDIKLQYISFSYPGSNKEIIKNQSITVRSNTSIALVGSTGCGKTTFVDIILGLLEPQNGKIFVDDTEITDINRKSWQKNFGYVPQTIYLTDDTIRNNIAFGINPEKIDDNAVIRAAQMANIHDFIDNDLKTGYDTIIGERGVRLSGGQRQRIGIARAVYHNPSVLILDEATSALDSVTENAIIDAIKNLSHKKTIIMIAHRISTVKSCDTIYLMDKGVIVDYGSYEKLHQRNATFRKMADGV